MNINNKILGILFVLIHIVGIGLAVYFHYRKQKHIEFWRKFTYQNSNYQSNTQEPTIKQANRDYSTAYKAEYLLTINEIREYRKLRAWADNKNLIVFTKVRLADLISPRGNQKDAKTLFWKIQAKHVDFVVCDQNIRVICIIELQDNSHYKADRIERDRFVREVLTSCGYRVVQTFGITNEILNKACGYNDLKTENRHDA